MQHFVYSDIEIERNELGLVKDLKMRYKVNNVIHLILKSYIFNMEKAEGKGDYKVNEVIHLIWKKLYI
jgi:hypothetical protein